VFPVFRRPRLKKQASLRVSPSPAVSAPFIFTPMPRVVANKAGGWWLGTFVWGAILIAFLFGANRLGKKFGSTKPQTMCVDNTPRLCAQRQGRARGRARAQGPA
jgi:hypothetical protein